jgi:hypothetical protein
VLLDLAGRIAEADVRMAQRLSVDVIERIVEQVPADWLEDTPHFNGPREQRAAYLRYLTKRLQPPRAFAEEAVRARTVHV